MSTVLQVRIDENTKEGAEFVLKSVGLDLSTAIRMFLVKVIRTGGIPFEPVIEEHISHEEFEEALKSIHEHSKKMGFDKMTLDEINEVIAEVRKERKNKR